MRAPRVAACLLAGVAFGCAAAPAFAGALSVNPVRIDLAPGRPVASVVVRNDAADPAVVQLEVVGWSQNDTEEVYAATTDVLATPPIFTIKPGAAQVVRIGLRRAPDASQELTYRLFLQEVPPARAADDQGMRVALRVGVPVFVTPQAPARSELVWQATVTADGLRVTLANHGRAHVKIADLELRESAASAPGRVERVATYVLPGKSRSWLLKADSPVRPGTTLRLRAHTDSNAELVADVVAAAP